MIKKAFITSITGVFLFCIISFAFLSLKPDLPTGECTGMITDDIFFGIRNLTELNTWCSDDFSEPCINLACISQPSDQDYLHPTEGTRDLLVLVNDIYRTNAGFQNSFNYWIEYGGDGQEICADDDVDDNIQFNCLVLENVNISCPQTIWIQVSTECDDCVAVEGNPNSPVTVGTWWKWKQMFGADELPAGACLGGSNVFLNLQDLRTNCTNLNTEWGCGPGEIQ
jgi:hypothetical protein